MSDASQGPGWWQASDGKWYPPELYPKDYEQPDEPTPEPDSAAEPAVSDMTTVVPPPAQAPVGQPPPVEAPPIEAPPTQAPPSDYPVQPANAAPPPLAGDVDATTSLPQSSFGEPTATIPEAPPPGWGAPTSVYGTEQAPMAPAAPSGSNVPAALIALVAAALAIVGSFLEWATPAEEGTVVLPPGIANITVPSFDGLDSNGVGTLVCGAVMALVAGLLLAKVRHVLLTAALIVAGVVAAGLFVYSYVDITGLDITINGTKVEGISFDPGIGLWVVLGGGVLSVIAGLLVKRS